MSFVKKAVKAVFKHTKKTIKKSLKIGKKLWSNKWFRIAAIIALSVFTMGVATVGFGAFAGVGSIGGFFGAVGTTMSVGMGTITGGLIGATGLGGAGAGAGAAAGAGGGLLGTAGASSAAVGTNIIGTAGIGIGTGVTGATAAAGTALSAGAQAAALTAGQIAASGIGAGAAGLGVAGSGLAGLAGDVAVDTAVNTTTKSLVTRMLSPLTANTTTGSLMRTGIIMGVQGYMRGKEQEQEAFYRDNKTVYGGPAFGGTDAPLELLQPFIDTRPSPTAPAGQQAPDPFAPPDAALADPNQPQGLLTPQQQDQFAQVQQQGVAGAPRPTATDLLLQQQQSSQPPPTDPAPLPGNIRPELLGVA
jgi:hypothetical protein